MKTESFDHYKADAERLADEKRESTERLERIESTSRTISDLATDGSSELNVFLGEMNSYLQGLEKQEADRQKELDEQTVDLIRSLNERWQKISDALKTMGDVSEAQDILQDEEEKKKWIEEFLGKSELLNEACKELGENFHSAITSTVEMIEAKQDETMERAFARTDALHSAFTASILSGCLIATCIAKWMGRDK